MIKKEDSAMKKNTFNFWMDMLIFFDFIALIFTGVLLRDFPSALSGTCILGVTRKDWVDLHWVLALSLILFIFIHLALHWNWAKGSSKRYLRVGPKTLVISVTLIIIFFGIAMPGYLTKDFPDKEVFKDTSTKESAYEVDKKDGISINARYQGLHFSR
jgi:hypothetical protein